MISIGLLVNRKKDKDYEYAAEIYEALKNAGANVYADDMTAKTLGIKNVLDYSKISAVFILGGDGTILRAAAQCAANNVKIMSVNLGRMGFLTEAEIPDIQDAVECVIAGRYSIEKRLMLHVQAVSAKGDVLADAHALNDAVITKKNLSRLIDIGLYVNGQLADEFDGDGIILSTPTGSTAYSLSAGGPIVCPKLDCMIATPICAHTLYSRSIILKCSDIVLVKQRAHGEGAVLSLDGRETCFLNGGDSVRVTQSGLYTEFIRIKERPFYSLLRNKLAIWNESKD
jgi:NAD+ kinase